jgi:hypothetical protein
VILVRALTVALADEQVPRVKSKRYGVSPRGIDIDAGRTSSIYGIMVINDFELPGQKD